jgi:Pycsar effector protein
MPTNPPAPDIDHHPTHKSIATMDDQLNFAWRNFEDQQAIIRASDLKAGYLVTFLLFFAASTIPLGEQVFPKLHWTTSYAGVLGLFYLATYLSLALGFVRSLYLISHVLLPRIARHHQTPREGSELLYYEHVARHRDSSHYFAAVSGASPEQLLRNVTDQVFELSQICKSKIDSLRLFSTSFKWTLAAWCVSTALGFWIMRLH